MFLNPSIKWIHSQTLRVIIAYFSHYSIAMHRTFFSETLSSLGAKLRIDIGWSILRLSSFCVNLFQLFGLQRVLSQLTQVVILILNVFLSVAWLSSDTANSVPFKFRGIKIQHRINKQACSSVTLCQLLLLSYIEKSHLLGFCKSSSSPPWICCCQQKVWQPLIIKTTSATALTLGNSQVTEETVYNWHVVTPVCVFSSTFLLNR